MTMPILVIHLIGRCSVELGMKVSLLRDPVGIILR